jgi:hypothetical protein
MKYNKRIQYASLKKKLWIRNILNLDIDFLKACFLSNLIVNLFEDNNFRNFL